ncbi:hypothetical protein [Chryseobacterium caseinilyticum]|uniref:RHS repeat-associated core domain-containing protein n=1 Tax=Chryseobacterium caseinilyticum TaxID=2771428 RepID=A0ABR8Z9K3_9FLAO|nr:hypothetical protein [Chryseobacterium caseinilyticum]MBD8081900.1 hypothetical protein [Chryseobacterium caseinilyticum]
MTSQNDKGITRIDYNFLNLPKYLEFNKTFTPRYPGGNTNVKTNYLYKADGTKLRKIYTYGSGKMNVEASTTTECIDAFQYEVIDTGGKYIILPNCT